MILIFLIILPWPVVKIEAVVQEQLRGHPLHRGLGLAVDLVELRGGRQQLHQRGLLHPGPVVFGLTLRHLRGCRAALHLQRQMALVKILL